MEIYSKVVVGYQCLKYIIETSRNKHRVTIYEIYRRIHSEVTYTSTNISSSENSENYTDSDSDNDNEPDNVLFMEIKSNEDLNSDAESESEGEVDLEAELISTLKYLKKFSKENKVLKEEAQGF